MRVISFPRAQCRGGGIINIYIYVVGEHTEGTCCKMSIKRGLPTLKKTQPVNPYPTRALLYFGVIKKSSTTDAIVRATAVVDQETVFLLLLFFYIFCQCAKTTTVQYMNRTACAHRAYVGRYILSLACCSIPDFCCCCKKGQREWSVKRKKILIPKI